MTLYLSTHFSLDELCASEIAARLGIENDAPPALMPNLRRLANTLEEIRSLLGVPVTIWSGYRCLAVNRELKSKDTSDHVKGLAADFIAPRFGKPLQVCEYIHLSDIEFDQLIYEFGRWTHIGLPMDGEEQKRQMFTIDKYGTRPGLLEVRR